MRHHNYSETESEELTFQLEMKIRYENPLMSYEYNKMMKGLIRFIKNEKNKQEDIHKLLQS